MSEVIESPATTEQAPAAAPAAPAPAAPASAAQAVPGAATATTEPPKSKWQETWREDMAGELHKDASPEEREEHDKLLKRLKRFNSPADAAKAIREHDKLISSGALKKQLPKNATPEQVAAWRQEVGIPESPDGYDLALPKDVALTDYDVEAIAEWTKAVHEANGSQEIAKAVAKGYMTMRDKLMHKMEAENAAAKRVMEDVLREEWGTDYRSNMDGIDALLRHGGSEVFEAIKGARMQDGTMMFHNPAVTKWLGSHAREMGFVGATVVPATGGDIGAGIDAEIKAIQDSMFNADGTRNKDYQKDTKKQERLVKLLEAKARRENA